MHITTKKFQMQWPLKPQLLMFLNLTVTDRQIRLHFYTVNISKLLAVRDDLSFVYL